MSSFLSVDHVVLLACLEVLVYRDLLACLKVLVYRDILACLEVLVYRHLLALIDVHCLQLLFLDIGSLLLHLRNKVFVPTFSSMLLKP